MLLQRLCKTLWEFLALIEDGRMLEDEEFLQPLHFQFIANRQTSPCGCSPRSHFTNFLLGDDWIFLENS